jgi:hypothetical protein
VAVGNVTAFLARWLAATQGAVRTRTHERYRQIVRFHPLPSLEKTKLTGRSATGSPTHSPLAALWQARDAARPRQPCGHGREPVSP